MSQAASQLHQRCPQDGAAEWCGLASICWGWLFFFFEWYQFQLLLFRRDTKTKAGLFWGPSKRHTHVWYGPSTRLKIGEPIPKMAGVLCFP